MESKVREVASEAASETKQQMDAAKKETDQAQKGMEDVIKRLEKIQMEAAKKPSRIKFKTGKDGIVEEAVPVYSSKK